MLMLLRFGADIRINLRAMSKNQKTAVRKYEFKIYYKFQIQEDPQKQSCPKVAILEKNNIYNLLI